ncbi:hypothetical protein [Chondromyces crocatus]|uniref:Uncharacterized protein n=1 Tax=Chondromyces crocatus TaxID=52 RepID=A0A0K1EP14_CHOCO|nr:hypothetical protein [Chondromyces crocatus]AKT42581.1 uncharacterized protein CMC5_068080 [Chondromyces crocatus]
MIQAFVEGGWAMWPLLVFGMVTIGAAGRFAHRPQLAQLRFIGAMSLLTFVTTFHATWLAISAVLSYLSKLEDVASDQLVKILFTGLMESTRAGGLGGLLLIVTLLLVAIGTLRLTPKQG